MNASVEILHVEDDPVDIENFRRAYALCGGANPVRAVGDGGHALELLRGELPEPSRTGLVLLDLGMPGLSGLDFLERLKADPELRSIPVVVLSASRHERDLHAAYELGAAGYLVKPLDFAGFVQLVAAVERYWSFCETPESRNG